MNQTRTNKLLTALLLLCVLFVCLAGPAMAANCVHTFENNVCTKCDAPGGYCGSDASDVWYTITENDTVLTIGGRGEMLPYDNSTNTPPWKTVHAETIEEIVIESGVTRIAGFAGLKNLKSVTIPASVTEIGGGTFEDCESLTTVNVPCDRETTYAFGENVTVNHSHRSNVYVYTELENGEYSYVCMFAAVRTASPTTANAPTAACRSRPRWKPREKNPPTI